MTFQNIQYFLAIVEEGNISAAARKLYISQQTLSEHLKKIETEIGTPLFDRGKQMSLTAAGTCFYNGSKELIHIYEDMMSDVRDITNKRRRKITIAVPTSRTPPYFPYVLRSFTQRYPEYEVAVIKRQHSDIARNMQGVDLYLSYWPLSPDLENYVLMDNDPFCVVFQRSLAERVFGERWESVEAQLIQTQDLSLLKEMPFILLRDRYGQMTADLVSVFREYQFVPTTAFNSENSELNDEMCINGSGCLLAPESYTVTCFYHNKNIQTNDLLTYPLKVTSFETKPAISYEKGKRLHAAEICFLREARDYFQKLSKNP